MENFSVVFVFLLAIIAFLYSSVGHGGASGYLALMAFFNFSPGEMRSSALLLNIFVSGIAFFQFYRSGNFRWNFFYPFAILAVPMAFAGAGINLETEVYKVVLGICLFFAAFRILGFFGKYTVEEKKQIQFMPALILGGLIGFISGIIGIGGGILLSPIMIFLRWANLKEAAAVSALFILVNSLSGFAGVINTDVTLSPQIYIWIIAALAGGLAGSYFGSKILNQPALRYLLSAVLIFAGFKLILI